MVNECNSSPPCRFPHLILFCKGEAQRKFGNAKSISSDQFHGNQDRVSILNHLTYINKLDVYNSKYCSNNIYRDRGCCCSLW